MKKYFTYFYVILPLFFIGLYQQAEKIETNSTIKKIVMQNDFVLLSVNKTDYRNLTKVTLEKKLSNIHSITEANDFLKEQLMSAKREKNSAYIGFALEVYIRLKEELQAAPEILSTYSDLLSFSHQFEQSSIVLEKLSDHPQHYDFAVIRLLNIKILKGEIINAEKQCQRTKSFNNYQVFIACQVWLKGMRSNDTNQLNQLASQLLALADIDKNNRLGSEFKSWLYQLSLELYLKSDDVVKAQLLLNKLLSLLQSLNSNENIDLAPLIQMIDYLIIGEQFALANQLMNQYDTSKQLIIRRVLIDNYIHSNTINSNENNKRSKINQDYRVAKETIQSYILVKDISKYRLLSLWNAFVENNRDKAKYFSRLNQQEYNTFIDSRIDKAIEKHFSNGKHL